MRLRNQYKINTFGLILDPDRTSSETAKKAHILTSSLKFLNNPNADEGHLAKRKSQFDPGGAFRFGGRASFKLDHLYPGSAMVRDTLALLYSVHLYFLVI